MTMQAITEAPVGTPEAATLPNSTVHTLREMHHLATKYLTLTGGGRSDGTEYAAVQRAGDLLRALGAGTIEQ